MTNSIFNSPDFFIIDQTQVLILGGVWEQIYLINKKRNIEIFLAEFDGVTDIVLLDRNNKRAIAANDKILVWKNKEVFVLDKVELKNVEGIVLIEDDLVKFVILTF